MVHHAINREIPRPARDDVRGERGEWLLLFFKLTYTETVRIERDDFKIFY